MTFSSEVRRIGILPLVLACAAGGAAQLWLWSKLLAWLGLL